MACVLSVGIGFFLQMFSSTIAVPSLLGGGSMEMHPICKVSKVSKQGLYFVKYNYEIFSLEIAAREKLRQDNAGPH